MSVINYYLLASPPSPPPKKKSIYKLSSRCLFALFSPFFFVKIYPVLLNPSHTHAGYTLGRACDNPSWNQAVTVPPFTHPWRDFPFKDISYRLQTLFGPTRFRILRIIIDLTARDPAVPRNTGCQISECDYTCNLEEKIWGITNKL